MKPIILRDTNITIFHFEASFGDIWNQSLHEVIIEQEDIITYKCHTFEKQGQLLIQPSSKKWKNFFSAIELLPQWPTNMEGPPICDGYYWHINIVSNAKLIVINAHDIFPEQFNTFSTALKKLLNIGSPENWPWDKIEKSRKEYIKLPPSPNH